MLDRSLPVCVIDDDRSIRESIGCLLSTAGYVVHTFSDADEFLLNPPEATAYCLIVDLLLPGLNGMELCRQLVAQDQPFAFIVITAHSDIPTAVEAMRMGAIDFLEKPFSNQDLIEATGRAMQVAIARHEVHREHENFSLLLAQLSPREREVLDFVAAGKSTKVIANQFGISPRTVDVHRSRIMSKLQIDSPMQLGKALEILRNHDLSVSSHSLHPFDYRLHVGSRRTRVPGHHLRTKSERTENIEM